MTKQEEIREGLVAMLMPELAQGQRADWLVNDILLWLRLKGVVIKVERELPESLMSHIPLLKEMLDEVSYVAVEPLIEG